ncbi:hypothetical protein ELQ87_08000 [Streptomyces griseoviridis]|uniref:Uncharacterized protein n=1 Tax=Streptomyces griseoviridis TaxID=45398 RepID=A0A3S9Z969_STRGD|nr:hypothetical protein [Streptomyces griseoviridis]AZS84229.1 hypothetical protein ELQ87_08000 [Streptomyces griseoviridis]QCN88912.1 hypothetical protein DDJ31_31345 [Streptomyces griseoviridis]
MDSTRTTATPAGTWSEHLVVEGRSYTSTLRFTANGRAMILAGPRPGSVGAGYWHSTGPDTFRFQIVELEFDADGVLSGWVDIDQAAVLHGDTFTCDGVSHVYDAHDRLLATVHAEGTSTRA